MFVVNKLECGRLSQFSNVSQVWCNVFKTHHVKKKKNPFRRFSKILLYRKSKGRQERRKPGEYFCIHENCRRKGIYEELRKDRPTDSNQKIMLPYLKVKRSDWFKGMLPVNFVKSLGETHHKMLT
uniref:Uncharacterized protein n=1 Tax=Cacopsylla melanoneura TaxID=428564 RepID=A0A8D8VE03_9HEMI